MGGLLVLGRKECLVECATLCVKSEIMLIHIMYKGLVAVMLTIPTQTTSKNIDKILLKVSQTKFDENNGTI